MAQRTLSQVKQSFLVQGETYADPTPKVRHAAIMMTMAGGMLMAVGLEEAANVTD